MIPAAFAPTTKVPAPDLDSLYRGTWLYISGPMSGHPDHNFTEFFRVQGLLMDKGFDCIVNPARKGVLPDWDWHRYMRFDLDEIRNQVGAIVTLHGFTTSIGATVEVLYGLAIGLPVYDAELGHLIAFGRDDAAALLKSLQ